MLIANVCDGGRLAAAGAGTAKEAPAAGDTKEDEPDPSKVSWGPAGTKASGAVKTPVTNVDGWAVVEENVGPPSVGLEEPKRTSAASSFSGAFAGAARR